MKNPIQKIRRLFVSTRRYNASAARAATPAAFDDEDGSNRLSGAFIIVLLLHVIAVAGVFAFARIKENRSANAPAEQKPAPAANSKPGAKTAPKADAAKTAAVAATNAHPNTGAQPSRDSIKAPSAGGRTTHIVKDGETLTKIAFAYNVSVADLTAANKIKDQNDLQPGLPLTIPEARTVVKATPTTDAKPLAPAPLKPAATPAQKPATAAVADKKPARSVTVRKGDTAAKIARENGCSYEDLVKLNNIKDPKKIQPGQTLKLPAKNG